MEGLLIGLFVLAVWLGSAFLAAKIAQVKGRSKWFLFGLLFPIEPLIIVRIIEDG